MQQMFSDTEIQVQLPYPIFPCSLLCKSPMPLILWVSSLAQILSFMIQFKRLKPMIPYPAP